MQTQDYRSPLEHLRAYYGRVERRCRACGFDAGPGAWESETDGSEVRYYRDCPSCGDHTEFRLELAGDLSLRYRVGRRQWSNE